MPRPERSPLGTEQDGCPDGGDDGGNTWQDAGESTNRLFARGTSGAASSDHARLWSCGVGADVDMSNNEFHDGLWFSIDTLSSLD